MHEQCINEEITNLSISYNEAEFQEKNKKIVKILIKVVFFVLQNRLSSES